MIDVLFIMPQKACSLKQEGNGTLILATKLLQAGFRTDILRFFEVEEYLKKGQYSAFIKKIVNRIIEKQPKCVAFYSLYAFYHIILRIAKEIKAVDPDIHIIFGGPQASLLAEETLKVANYVDYICYGEGENTVVPFFRALFEKKDLSEVAGLFYRKDGKIVHTDLNFPLCNLDEVPRWDDRLYPSSNYSELEPRILEKDYYMPLDVGRGCPFNCIYCATSLFWRRTFRLKTPEQIVSDMQYYMEKFGIKSFLITHDAFTVNNKLVESFCDIILEKKLDVKWICCSRIDCVTKDLLLKMKHAGMVQIQFGIETVSERLQKLINKNLDLSKAAEIFDFLQENDISACLFFMYGFPDETEEELNSTLEFMFSMMERGFSTLLNFCAFDANTPMTNQYLDQLVLDSNIKILSHNNFGLEEEQEIIRQNRALFPFFYHLDTPLRNEFQHLRVLRSTYSHYPNTVPLLRKLYHGDNLQFYRDFVSNNPELMAMTFDDMLDESEVAPPYIIQNAMNSIDQPFVAQLKELAQYDYDLRQLISAKEDVEWKRTYGFSILDLKRKLPIEKYHQAETDILFKKSGDVTTTKILDIR